LSGTDWSTFNSKQQALNGTGFVKISGTTISYDNSTYLTTAAAASTYLPLAGGTMTGQIVLTTGTGGGIRFPNDPFGGGSDTAGMRLISRGGEAMSLEIYTTNDADDWVNISVPSNDSAKVNGNTIWNAGNITPVPTSRTITINGTTQDLSDNRTYNVGTVTSVTASSPLFSSGGATPNITIQQASGSQNGFLSSTDWTTFNNKQAALNGTGFVKISGTTISYDNSTYLTTAAAASTYVPYTGATSGVDIGTYTLSASNLIANGGFNAGALLLKQSSNAQTIFLGYTAITPVGNNTLNFGFSTGSGVWKNFTLSSFLLTDNINRTYTLPDASGTIALVGGSGVGTVTSVAALTLGTAGTDLSSSVANSTTTPVITLNVPTASAANRGALSAADWTTFNNKQNALTNPVTGTGDANYLPKFTGASTIGNSIVQDSGSLVTIGGALTVTSNVTIRPTSGYNAFFQTSGTALRINYLNDALSANISATYRATDFGWQDSGGNSILTLNSSGILGVGVTPSAWNLGKAIEFSSASIWALSTTDINYLSNTYFNGSFRYVNNHRALRYYQDSDAGIHAWFTAPSGTAGNAISFTQAMTLGTNSGLSIGTPSAAPAQGLLVQGEGRFNAPVAIGAGTQSINADAELTLRDGVAFVGLDFKSARTSGNVGGLRFYNTSSDSVPIAQQLIETDGKFVFYNGTSGAEPRLTLASTGAATFSGNVGIGVAPDVKLDVNGSVYVRTGGILYLDSIRGYSSGTLSTTLTELALSTGFNISGANVGIGATPNAGFKLDVNGTGRFSSGSSDNPLLLTTTSSNGTILGLISTSGGTQSWGINSYTNGVLYFQSGTIGAGTNAVYFTSAGAATFSSSVTAASFIPTGSTIPTNGMYLPSANTIAFSTNTTERMRITSAGEVQLKQSSNSAQNSVIFNTTNQNAMTLNSSGNLILNGTTGSSRITCYGDGFFSGGIQTGNPYGTTAANWLLGRFLTETTSVNGSIRVQIGSKYYNIAAEDLGTVPT
jgi:hypothetical protein